MNITTKEKKKRRVEERLWWLFLGPRRKKWEKRIGRQRTKRSWAPVAEDEWRFQWGVVSSDGFYRWKRTRATRKSSIYWVLSVCRDCPKTLCGWTNLHTNSVRQVSLLFLFYRWGCQAQKGYMLCSRTNQWGRHESNEATWPQSTKSLLPCSHSGSF